jgi:hypothetical protein
MNKKSLLLKYHQKIFLIKMIYKKKEKLINQ